MFESLLGKSCTNRGVFYVITPFFVTADVALGLQAITFMCHLAEEIAQVKSNSESAVCKDAFCCPSCHKSVHS